MKQLKEFLNSARSAYHAVALLQEKMEQAGYTALPETQQWELAPGGKYYVVRGGSAVIAFRLPKVAPTGFIMSASHSDRPTFKIKENWELSGKYTQVATEKYGGMLIAPWLDRPLSIAGRVLVETEEGVESRLLDIDRDLLLIPNVAVHMDRKVNEGYAWNPAVDTLPLAGSAEAKGKLQTLLEQTAGGKLLGHDLYLYIREKASIWGVEEEYLSAAALDDLLCAWCCTCGFIEAEENDAVNVLCVFDCEEVGSSSAQGADSTFLEDVLRRICADLNLPEEQLLRRSFMVSADNAHAIHPNHPEHADPNNAPVLGQGVVLKFNAAQRYTTDGVSGAIFRKICDNANVPVQTYYNRADKPGGSTLGYISLAHISVPTADVGIAQLAMHSCYETAGVKDIDYMLQAMKSCYSTTLCSDGKGSWQLKTNYRQNA